MRDKAYHRKFYLSRVLIKEGSIGVIWGGVRECLRIYVSMKLSCGGRETNFSD